MRCERARRWMAAALDAEVAPRRRRALERHLAACDDCREEMALEDRLARALGSLSAEAEVPARLEQSVLRRVRLEAQSDSERWGVGAVLRAWWPVLTVPALATAAVMVLALGTVLRAPSVVPLSPASHGVPGPAAPGRVAKADGEPRTARPASPQALARVERKGRTPVPPGAPPPELASAPELFVDLPILRNMDKLEHFDAILTTDVDEDDRGPGQEPQSNG